MLVKLISLSQIALNFTFTYVIPYLTTLLKCLAGVRNITWPKLRFLSLPPTYLNLFSCNPA